MKEATGELSMTTITIIAVIAIATIVGLLRQPIRDFIETKFGEMTGNPDFRLPVEEEG